MRVGAAVGEKSALNQALGAGEMSPLFMEVGTVLRAVRVFTAVILPRNRHRLKGASQYSLIKLILQVSEKTSMVIPDLAFAVTGKEPEQILFPICIVYW